MRSFRAAAATALETVGCVPACLGTLRSSAVMGCSAPFACVVPAFDAFGAEVNDFERSGVPPWFRCKLCGAYGEVTLLRGLASNEPMVEKRNRAPASRGGTDGDDVLRLMTKPH